MFKLILDNQFGMVQSEWIALTGLLFVTLAFLFYKEGIMIILFIVLVLGMVNLAQFETQLGLSIRMEARMPNSPGYSDIQLLSLVLMSVFATGRRNVIIHFFRTLFKNTEKDLQNEKEARQALFLKKFDAFSDVEIEKKLKEPLAPEAEAALIEIQKKRMSHLKHTTTT